nr:TPM domain-containing protein [uncultured Desulfuromonas sp.]
MAKTHSDEGHDSVMTSTSVSLSEAQQNKIRQAVAQAESTTSGEIVPLILPSAGEYQHVEIRFGALLSMALTLFLLWWIPAAPLWGVAAVMAASYLLGGLVVRITPGLKRFLVGTETLNDTVSEKAFTLFIQQGLHYTRDATGILILVSLFEKRVEILADRGINEKVDQQQWQQAVDTIVEGLHQDTMVDSLCRAIESCGTLLAQHCPQREDDENELPDLIVH